MPYIRDDQADIRVSLDGTPYGGSWSTVSGGELAVSDSKTRPGGMGHEVSVGGPASRGDLTATIQMSDIVATWIRTFENRAGKGALKVSITYLDAEGLPLHTDTLTGTLKTVTRPDMDSNGTAMSFFSIVGSMNETAA